MRILIRHQDGREESIELDASQTLRVGARSSADVVLSGTDVSPLHLGILLRHGVFVAVAFKKVGKICVNGRRVRKAVLHAGDQIAVGANLIDVIGPRTHTHEDVSGAATEKTTGQHPPDRPAKTSPRPAIQVGELLDELADLAGEPDLLGGIPDELLVTTAAPSDPGKPSGGDRRQRRAAGGSASAASRFFQAGWFKGGLLLLLILPLVVLVGVYLQQLPDVEERFLAADQYFQQRDFPRAAEAFAALLASDVLEHDGGELYRDEARVKRHLAILLDGLDRGVDAATLWQQLAASVDEWGAGRHCGYAQAGLAQLLPPVVTDLTRRGQLLAEQGGDETARESLRQAGDALQMIYRLVPPGLQRRAGLVRLQLHFTQLQRELNQPAALRDALQPIQQLAPSGDIATAYAIRSKLLSEYPELASDGRLLAAMRAVGRAACGAVRMPAERGETKPDAQQPVWLADATSAQFIDPPNPTEKDPRMVAALLPDIGAVYGIDVANKRVLWRYAVGFRDTYQPLQLDAANLVLVDSVLARLVGVNAATGESVWHMPLQSLAGPPVVGRDCLLVAYSSGVVTQIDRSCGKVLSQLQLPQPLQVAPAVDPSEARCYQLAEHSTIYVLSHDQSKCLSSFYLGHEWGTVALTPSIVGAYLLVCEQIGPADTEVHVLLRGDELQPIQTLTLPACVSDAPIAIGNTVYLSTRDGRVLLLRSVAGDERRPFRPDGAIRADVTRGTPGVPVTVSAIDGQLCLAGDGVATYRVTDEGALPQLLSDQWRGFRVSQLVQSVEGTVVAFGRVENEPGYVAHGWRTGEGGSTLRMSLAASPAAPPLVSASSDNYWVLTRGGSLHRGSVSQLLDGRRGTCVSQLPVTKPATNTSQGVFGTAVWCGSTALLGPPHAPDRVVIVREEKQHSMPSWRQLPQPLSCSPLVLDGQFLMAFEGGPLCLFDEASGEFAAEPFLPSVRLGERLAWKMPAVLPDGRVLVSDGQTRLFLLKPRGSRTGLELISECPETVRFPAGLVAIKGDAWGVDDRSQLQRIVTSELAIQAGQVLSGELQWGPVVVEDRGFVATTQGDLVCFGQPTGNDWTSRLDIGPIVGICALNARQLAVASSPGVICIVSAETGEVVGSSIVTQQRLAFGPVLMHGHLTVLTEDSCLLMTRSTIDELMALRAGELPPSHADRKAVGTHSSRLPEAPY